MTMLVPLDGEGPLYRQIYRVLRGEILARRLRPGDRLPSTRWLSADLGVSRNVALLAYEQLLAEGYAESRVGSGTIVAPTLPDEFAARLATTRAGRSSEMPMPRLSNAGERIVDIYRKTRVSWEIRGTRLPYDFRFGRPAFGDFPHAVWCRLLGRRARGATLRDLDYGPPEGRIELREAIADHLRRTRGVDARPERLLIVNGSQQALDLVTRVLIDPGARVLIDEPHYSGARHVFVAAGATLVPSPVDDSGLTVPKPAPRGRAPRLAYVTPSHQFPTGVVMPLGRRLELLDWAARSDAFIVEDDYDSEYRYQGRPLQALAGLDGGGRVLYVGTFSKLLFPALRLGYVLAPENVHGPLAAAKALADTGTAMLEQLTLADFLREGHYERHLRRSREKNARRRAALLEALAEHFGSRVEISGANTGLHVLAWLRGKNGRPISAITRRAAAAGVGVSSVAPFFLRPPERSGVLLGYGALTEREIREGVKRLAAALDA
jgi:GntR family transcriptional regulator/MocR family aminotransferase